MSKRWCHACGRPEEFDSAWYELSIDRTGACVTRAIGDPRIYDPLHLRNSVLACGQGSALVLLERYLHTRTFTLPAARNAALLELETNYAH